MELTGQVAVECAVRLCSILHSTGGWLECSKNRQMWRGDLGFMQPVMLFGVGGQHACRYGLTALLLMGDVTQAALFWIHRGESCAVRA